MAILFNPLSFFILLASLFIYWVALKTTFQKNLFLFFVSFSLIAYLHPIFAVAALFLVIFSHIALKQGINTKCLFIGFISVSLLFGIGKYGTVLTSFFSIEGDWVSQMIVFPLGLSYFVFRWIQFVLDSCRGSLSDSKLSSTLSFFFFFPVIPAGPIESFQTFYKNRSSCFEMHQFQNGIKRIVLGYFKKLVLVELLFKSLFGSFTSGIITGSIAISNTSPEYLLAFLILVFIHAYLDLSAYSDIAIGLSSLFGFKIMENFHFPFLQKNLSSFWRSWHISLSLWCRNNVYFPVLGISRKPALAILACMLTMGLWHQINLNWLFWGLYHGFGLILLNKFHQLKRINPRLTSLIDSFYFRPLAYLSTFLFVALGYAFVALPNIRQSFELIAKVLSPLAPVFS